MEAIGGIGIILYLAFILLILISYWKIYTKAGKPGWACLVPIYGTIVLLQVIGKPWWWLIMFCIPVVNLIFLIMATNLLSKSFGKETGFTIGLILLPIIFIPILGLGSAKYNGPAGAN